MAIFWYISEAIVFIYLCWGAVDYNTNTKKYPQPIYLVGNISMENQIFNMDEVYFDDNLNIWRSRSLIDVSRKGEWDRYYKKYKSNILFHKLSSLYKRVLTGAMVKRYADKFLPKDGTVLEAGSGTGESSNKIPKRNRTFIAVDILTYPLVHHKNLNADMKLEADILKLPIKDNCIDAVFNLGVHEHFSWEENIKILKEYRRMLRPHGIILLFWPWKNSWISFTEGVRQLFPKSYMAYGAFDAKKLFSKGGLELLYETPFSLDGLHIVVVCKTIK